MKTIEDYFADWESHVFGYGYGTGEEHVLCALKQFLACVPFEGCYDYRKLESDLSAPVAWLLINTLVNASIIEYGTSPRHGWLTKQGEALREFVANRSVAELVNSTMQDGHDTCCRDYCNCGDGDCRPGNPFWPKRYIGINQ